MKHKQIEQLRGYVYSDYDGVGKVSRVEAAIA